MLLPGERYFRANSSLKCGLLEVAPASIHCGTALSNSRLLLSAQESGGPPVGLQVFVGTLALFAVPVVAWSLYTLSMTGNIALPPWVYIALTLAMPHLKTKQCSC